MIENDRLNIANLQKDGGRNQVEHQSNLTCPKLVRGTIAAEADQPYYEAAQPPANHNLEVLREAASRCQACHLWIHATQTVFGEGPTNARLVLIGEQPGDREDVAGKPFVGPAGQLLDRCLNEAGIDRRATYVTNAVKHFKWLLDGPRRLHQKPNRREVLACRPWLEAEIEDLDPDVIVCMGATAAQSVLGPDFRLTAHRAEFVPSPYRAATLATLHPSAILRARDDETRERDRQSFVRDLRLAAARIDSKAGTR